MVILLKIYTIAQFNLDNLLLHWYQSLIIKYSKIKNKKKTNLSLLINYSLKKVKYKSKMKKIRNVLTCFILISNILITYAIGIIIYVIILTNNPFNCIIFK